MARVSEFPNGFTENPQIVQMTDVAAKHGMVFEQLRIQGFLVVAGLDRAHVADLTEIADQKGVREFCPNDILKRWTDEPTAEKQLGKDGGRAVFRLQSATDGSTLGYGWTGKSSEEEHAHLPECHNTFALRLHEKARGQRLAAPFSRAIVAGSMALYGVRRIGLETWGSNTAAVKSYLKAGAELIDTKDDIRDTYVSDVSAARADGQHGRRRDVRLYMQYPWSF